MDGMDSEVCESSGGGLDGDETGLNTHIIGDGRGGELRERHEGGEAIRGGKVRWLGYGGG